MIIAQSLQSDKPVPALKYSGGMSVTWLPKTVQRFDSKINTMAKRYNIDANLVVLIMTFESGGYTRADSGQARGLMQVTPYTGQDIAKKFVQTPREQFDLFDVDTSIEFGAAYLSYLRNEFCPDEREISPTACAEIIAAGYNGGPGAANSLMSGNGLKAEETVIYSRNVYNAYREKSADQSPTYQRWYAAGGKRLIDSALSEM